MKDHHNHDHLRSIFFSDVGRLTSIKCMIRLYFFKFKSPKCKKKELPKGSCFGAVSILANSKPAFKFAIFVDYQFIIAVF
jgi:hypothetical protein